MSARVCRTFRLLPGARLNVSKSGISASIDLLGARLTHGPRGTRTTVGLPWAGDRYTESSFARGAGGDRTSNAIAPCSNCHRRAHFGSDKADFVAGLLLRVGRLANESVSLSPPFDDSGAGGLW